MTKRMRAFMWYEKVTLRGIAGLISDRMLLQVVKDENFDDAMMNQFEANNMAEAVYAQARGWTD